MILHKVKFVETQGLRSLTDYSQYIILYYNVESGKLMIESSKYEVDCRELPSGARQYSKHTEWTHEGSPNDSRR